MAHKQLRKINGKKKICSFNISEDSNNKLTKKVGYNNRSKTVDNLISNYVKKGPHRRREPRIPSNGQSNGGYDIV